MELLYEEASGLVEKLGGNKTIKRASHVEPDTKGEWWVQVIQGPTLGPFTKRSEAIKAEIAWLETNRLA